MYMYCFVLKNGKRKYKCTTEILIIDQRRAISNCKMDRNVNRMFVFVKQTEIEIENVEEYRVPEGLRES